MRLYHFSDDPTITRFHPRPVITPSVRASGQEWLNGPLVWAIDDWHAPMYLFPRDCPRILLWPLDSTTPHDRARWLGNTSARMVAYIERDWWPRIRAASIFRYELPPATFATLDDAGMHVSHHPVDPLARTAISDLPAALLAADTELRVVERLASFRPAWDSTLHASGIRLRNAKAWR